MHKKKLLTAIHKDVKPEIPEIDSLIFGDWIFSMGNTVVKHVGSRLLFSDDAGATYINSLDISQVGALRVCYVFPNGNLMLGNHTQMFYSPDWINIYTSNVFDIDGTPFIPVLTTDNFTPWTFDGFPQTDPLDDSINVLMWNNYNYTENVNGSSTARRYTYDWYTEDFGQNIRCVFSGDVSIAENESTPLRKRHGHGVFQHPIKKYWISCSGDEPQETDSHWSKCVKNLNGNFTTTVIGKGYTFKTNLIRFMGDEIYYSIDNAPGGVGKVLEVDMGDANKHIVLLSIPNDTCGISMNNKGEIVTTHSLFVGTLPSNVIHYSNDFGSTWFPIELPYPEGSDGTNGVYLRGSQPNSRGKVLMGSVSNYGIGFFVNTIKPSIWIDNFIRAAGFPNAFK